mmetsp:Transcript_30218/g.99981  ORF Transcript_30218/g.99981 Transcript_30218/m.99981 type:complete len:164 (+) Transcript_30218:322-813(+)
MGILVIFPSLIDRARAHRHLDCEEEIAGPIGPQVYRVFAVPLELFFAPGRGHRRGLRAGSKSPRRAAVRRAAVRGRGVLARLGAARDPVVLRRRARAVLAVELRGRGHGRVVVVRLPAARRIADCRRLLAVVLLLRVPSPAGVFEALESELARSAACLLLAAR